MSDMSITDCECRSSVDKERDKSINCDRTEVAPVEEHIYIGRRIVDDYKRTDPEELQQDEAMNIGQKFEVFQTNDNGTSELPKYQL